MRLLRFISANRWPALVAGLLSMSVVAHGVLVFVATGTHAPRPIPDYYRRARQWDADAAVVTASEQLGWRVDIEVPTGEPYALTSRRPVDVTIHDRDGQPITGLLGKLLARPPAQSREVESALVELPYAPGHYRSLAPLAVPGLWQMRIDARLGAMPFVHSTRVQVVGGRP